jgi:N-acylglucosamine 2-epimerase/mannose-6-phosphate isomerase
MEADALPLWSTQGVWSNGCFVENFSLIGAPEDPGFTRTRLQARQIYVFANAHVAGFGDYSDLLDKSAAFFTKFCWLGSDYGWARRITRDGALIDDTPDLYDLAFALFALAWLYRVTKESCYLALAYTTLDFIESKLVHPEGGFLNDVHGLMPRQQNPHMHLTEAMVAWMEVTADERFLDIANKIILLLETRFYDSTTGALGEFFTSNWMPSTGNEGQIVEPGHQLEWAWILCHHRRLGGTVGLDTAERMIEFARQYGCDPLTGSIVDQVTRDGHLLSGGQRLWPQTESLKAALAESEFLGAANTVKIDQVVNSLFERFLDPAPLAGTWVEHFNEDGTRRGDRIPASSLYHLCLAFFELLRLERKVE